MVPDSQTVYMGPDNSLDVKNYRIFVERHLVVERAKACQKIKNIEECVGL